MKALETTLTWILIPAFLLFLTSSIMSVNKLNAEKAKKDAIAAAAEKEANERAERTIKMEISHDSDPATNTVSVSIVATATDPEGDEVSYNWTQIGGASVDLQGTENTSTISFDAEAGEYEFMVSASDSYNSTCSETVIINVGAEPNTCPEITTYVAQNVVFERALAIELFEEE